MRTPIPHTLQRILLFFSFYVLVQGCIPADTSVYKLDVLVVGGGASGIAAGIQAARSGAQVLIVEETPWLGGMLTAAGVGATDGNHRLPSGIWGEFRQHIRDYYGGAKAVETGWVSNTLFEPHVGNQIWNTLADQEAQLQRFHGYRLKAVEMKADRIYEVLFEHKSGEEIRVRPVITIDATELGDLLVQTGAAFLTGVDTPTNPHDPNIQDLTYVALVKDFGPDADKSIPKPKSYDPSEFDCICKEVCDDPEKQVPDCETFLNYGRMPNDKFMLNWPNNGNDYFLNPIPLTNEEREEAYKAAKERSLSLLYFLQTEAGYKNLGLADDEYPTEDLLPFIPYHREARRIVGKIQFKLADLLNPYADSERPYYKQAIAVGDYPLDHHHDKNPQAKPEEFPPIPSFSVPYLSLVPQKIKGLLVAEKSISVSHRVNGATRLQPCVILIGQAAGMAAALCAKEKYDPDQLDIRILQEQLLDAGCWLMPFIDTQPKDWFFKAAQKAGLEGKIKGHGVPYKWANQTWFYPDSALLKSEFSGLFPISRIDIPEPDANQITMTRIMFLQEILRRRLIKEEELTNESPIFSDLPPEFHPLSQALKEKGLLKYWAEGENFHPQQALTRKEAVWVLDQLGIGE